MKVAIALALLGVAVVAAGTAPLNLDLSQEQMEWLFSSWRKHHGREYATSDEAIHRFQVFADNVKWIHATNQKGLSYSVGINQFADLTNAEWKHQFMGTRVPESARVKPVSKSQHTHRGAKKPQANPPASWDWRTHGAVNPVQNQGQCGSCWAFTAGDAISGLWAIKTGMLFPVSVQEIVDCSGSQGNQGCNGGLPSSAFAWVVANGGICDWQEYAYTAETGTCQSSNCTNVARISGSVSIAEGDEAALMPATYVQPLSLAVQADTQSFQFYTGGVLDDPTCGTQVDHGVTLIGWGTDAGSKKDYWLVRNMWGTNWGEQGYIRLVRGKNMCGVAEAAAYPTL